MPSGGIDMRTESQDYKGFEIQVAHNPPIWQASIFNPKSPRVFPVNRALLRISCQIKGDAFAKARERIDEVLYRMKRNSERRESSYVERYAACTDRNRS